jgi:cell shape-determining protein MreC
VLYSTDAFPQFFRERSTLIEELNTFKYTQSAQSGDKLTVRVLTQENEELRALLSSTKEERILAGVIGRPFSIPYDTLVLDKGSDAGVVEGAPVFIGENAVIGIVRKVFDHSSLVVLTTTPGVTTSVFIMGPNIYTNAEGIGGGQLKIGVPQGIELEVGNVVIIPGASSGIYGEISHIDSVPSDPQQYAYVSPPVPLQSLRLVSVGKTVLHTLSFEEAQGVVDTAQKNALVVPIPEGILVTPKTGSTSSSTLELPHSSSTP